MAIKVWRVKFADTKYWGEHNEYDVVARGIREAISKAKRLKANGKRNIKKTAYVKSVELLTWADA